MFHTKGLIRLCLDIVTETHISKFNSLLDSPNLLVRRTHIHTLSACGQGSPFFHCILLSFLPWWYAIKLQTHGRHEKVIITISIKFLQEAQQFAELDIDLVNTNHTNRSLLKASKRDNSFSGNLIQIYLEKGWCKIRYIISPFRCCVQTCRLQSHTHTPIMRRTSLEQVNHMRISFTLSCNQDHNQKGMAKGSAGWCKWAYCLTQKKENTGTHPLPVTSVGNGIISIIKLLSTIIFI